jgi:cell division protein FtsX
VIDMRARRPWWRRALAYAGNAWRLVVLSGVRSWRRDLSATTPALGSMTLLLLLTGVFGLVGVALAHAAADQAASASVLDVYLASDASSDDIAGLHARLAADHRVASVRMITPEEALAAARSRPGLGDLTDLASANPFSGALEVRVRLVSNVGAVAASVQGDPAVDSSQPTSYDPEAYRGLRDLVIGVGAVGLVLVLLLAFVSYAVCANAIRGLALARREEIALVRLLSARKWMIRGPFVVEGVTTGAFAGLAAAALVGGVWWLLSSAGSAVFVAVLPGVGLRAVELDAAVLISAGMVLGAVSAAFGVRRLAA